MAAEKSSFANIDAIDILRCGRSSRKPGAVWLPNAGLAAGASPGSYSFREDPKLLALFAQHERRRT